MIKNRFMKLAFSLAKKANPFPNPRVGAVLVKEVETRNGKLETVVLGVGYHKAAGRPHAEIEAIQNAILKTRNPHAARGATLYVSLEPCSHTMKRTPPCTKAIIENGITRVVYAMRDPNLLVSGAKELKRAGIAILGPTNEKEAKAFNKKYIANISKKPFVAIKMAMSADGKTATRTGDSKWISGPESHDYVHRMRAGFDAVMVGAGTVEKDDPEITAHGVGRDPYRIIIDGRLRVGLGSKVLRKRDGKTIIATSEKAPIAKAIAIERDGSRVFVCGEKEVDLRKLTAALSAMRMKRILIEGGSELNAKALEAGIVDKLYLFIAPKIIGGRDAKPIIGGVGIAKMGGAKALKIKKMKKVGDDVLMEFDVSRSA